MVNQLFIEEKPDVSLKDVIFDEVRKEQLNNLIKEYTHFEILDKYNLPINNKVLFFGKTGCGKTMTAKALANHLQKKLISVNLGTIVSSKLGETSKNLTSIFKKASREKSILFLDEFDSLGKIRDYDRDSGEMKRVVNTLLQLIDYLPNDTLLICATNQKSMIDEALLRRFELKMEFQFPSDDLLNDYYNQLLKPFPEQFTAIEKTYRISFAEAKNNTLHQIKQNIIRSEEEKFQTV
ncbi:MAG: AAA family ATPase [Flavobacteriales bacterium]